MGLGVEHPTRKIVAYERAVADVDVVAKHVLVAEINIQSAVARTVPQRDRVFHGRSNVGRQRGGGNRIAVINVAAANAIAIGQGVLKPHAYRQRVTPLMRYPFG